jgi:hypothetical protein
MHKAAHVPHGAREFYVSFACRAVVGVEMSSAANRDAPLLETATRP